MNARRIRCECGRVYDVNKHPACPDCGAENVATLPVVVHPDEPKDNAAPPAIPSVERDSARRPPPPNRLSLGVIGLIAAAVLGVIVILVAVTRCGSKEEATKEKSASPIAPTLSPAATPRSGPNVFVFPPSGGTPAGGGQSNVGLTSDLVTMLANAESGATIKVPPGVYPGGLVVNKAVRIVGTGGQVFIQSEGRECLSVRASGVAVQNVQFMCNGIGELPAISVAENADLELEGCKVQSSTAVGISVSGNAAIKALGSGFTASNGIAVRLNQQTRGAFTQCSFADSKVALSVWNGATAELHSCAFDRNGGAEAKGGTIALSGNKTTLSADDCHFNNNTVGISAVEGATLTIANSSFKDNGITPRSTSVLGLIALYSGSSGKLTNDTFESNQQGVTVTEGSTMEIEKCQFTANGVRQMRDIFPTCQPIAAYGKGAVVTVRNSAIDDSAQYGATAMAGAKIIMEDVGISGTRSAGLVVGDRGSAPAEAEVKRGHFVRNGTGIGVFAGSSASVEETECRENQDGIIVLDKESRLKAAKLTLVGNRDTGIFVHGNAEVSVVDSEIRNNARGAASGTRGKAAERASLLLDSCRMSGNRTFGVGAYTQSELILLRCQFDGTDKANVYKERGANVQMDAPAAPSPSPQSSAEPSPGEENAESSPTPTSRPRPKPTARPRVKRGSGEDEAARILRRIFTPR